MGLIQQWSNPHFIYLFIFITGMLILLVHHTAWRKLRAAEMTSCLTHTSFDDKLRPLRIRCIFAELTGFLLPTLVLIVLPINAILSNLIIIAILNICLSIGIYFYEDAIIRKAHLIPKQAKANVGAMVRHPFLSSGVIRTLLFISACSLLITAAMGPEGNERTTRLRRIPMHATAVFDLSRSMLAQDLAPSRLEAAKDELNAFLNKVSGDEIGLIFFTDTTLMQSPQTYDLKTLETFITLANPHDMPTHGTDISKALNEALRTFNTSDDSYYIESELDLRRVILITDGEDHSSNLDSVLERYNARRIHIDVLAIGTESGSKLKDDRGKEFVYQDVPVVSKLQRESLMKISSETGGIYTEYKYPHQSSQALLDAWDGIRIDMNKEQNGSFARHRTQMYPWFLYPAFFFLILWIVYPMLVRIVHSIRQPKSAAASDSKSAQERL